MLIADAVESIGCRRVLIAGAWESAFLSTHDDTPSTIASSKAWCCPPYAATTQEGQAQYGPAFPALMISAEQEGARALPLRRHKALMNVRTIKLDA
eukprot:g72624.t1